MKRGRRATVSLFYADTGETEIVSYLASRDPGSLDSGLDCNRGIAGRDHHDRLSPDGHGLGHATLPLPEERLCFR
jgi:hypothetical protein